MPKFVRRSFHPHRRLPQAVLPLAITAILSVAFFVRLSLRLSPLVEAMATSKAVNEISALVNDAVDECLVTKQMEYKDFVDMDADSSGRITSLSFRVAEGSRFKAELTMRLIEKLNKVDTGRLSVPVGNLTDVIFFSALGPDVRVSIRSVGDVVTAYEHEFTDAGVNQTRHAIFLNVSVTVYLMIPGKIIPVTSEERVCIAETIIVGEVPDAYLNLQDGAA